MKSALQTLIERGSPDEILENCGEYDLQTLDSGRIGNLSGHYLTVLVD
mgnify:CR=1 FL=1